uniref:Uncharacterized protein n=1 Tax=Arundo donax TaxID=35708 RepID=A0A0A9F8C2_ARUDO
MPHSSESKNQETNSFAC